ncbi:MAG TPA: hypothetical protein VHC19_27850 [Pirellulales bacterium]|nr:hypothetical protein [Pirellulales bacterium]
MKRGEMSAGSAENRSIESLTIGWMLTVFTALACEVGFVAARWLAGGDTESSWAILMALLLFASTVIGLLVLLLTPVVVKSRRQPPPRGIVIFSVVVGAMPLAIVVWQMMSS